MSVITAARRPRFRRARVFLWHFADDPRRQADEIRALQLGSTLE
jgi:hypothetical protein